VGKAEIINLLNKGQSREAIARIYGVGAATVSDIKKE
jgi:transposase